MTNPHSPAYPRSLGDRWRALGPAARTGTVVVALLVIVNLALSLLDSATRGADETGPTSSAFSTGSRGLAAYADLLRRYDHPVRAQRGDLADTDLDASTTLVVLDPSELSDADTPRLRSFVGAGGRLVAGGADPTWATDIVRSGPTWSPRGVATAPGVGDAPEVAGVRRIGTAGEGSWTTPGDTDVLAGSMRRSIATVGNVGDGRVVFLADASPLQNRLLASDDNAAFGVAIAGERGRPVVFAEGTHGYGSATGISAIPARWKLALLATMLAALLTMLAAGRRVGPPEDEARILAPPRRAYVDALARALERSRRPVEAIAPLQAATRARLARRLGLAPDADDASLRAGAAGLGWPADEIEAVLTPALDDRTVLAAGRALARIEGGPS